jgi:hypothetical protein
MSNHLETSGMSKNNNQGQQGQVCHIDLQLSERCNALTLSSAILGLIEKLNCGLPQVTGLRVEVEQSQQSIQMVFSSHQEPSTDNDIYSKM